MIVEATFICGKEQEAGRYDFGDAKELTWFRRKVDYALRTGYTITLRAVALGPHETEQDK